MSERRHSINSHSKFSRERKKTPDKAVACPHLDLESIFCYQLCSCKNNLWYKNLCEWPPNFAYFGITEAEEWFLLTYFY